MDGSLFPRTRWQALGWALKEHFPRFVLLSLLSFLFAFPLWVYFLFFSFYFSAPEPFSLPSLLSYLALIPLNAIAFLGQGGLFWCARKTAFLEGSSPKEDFFLGVRRTFRESLLSGVLFSSLYVLLKFALSLLFSLSLPSFAYPCLSGFLYCLAFLLGLPFASGRPLFFLRFPKLPQLLAFLFGRVPGERPPLSCLLPALDRLRDLPLFLGLPRIEPLLFPFLRFLLRLALDLPKPRFVRRGHQQSLLSGDLPERAPQIERFPSCWETFCFFGRKNPKR